MGERAEALAKQFEQVSRQVEQAIEQCSDGRWRAECKEESWSVAVTAHHIAMGIEPIAGGVRAIASVGAVPGMSMEQVHKGNEEHAKQYANCSKQETLELVRRGTKSAADMIGGLSDEQLDRTAAIFSEVPPMSAQQMIESILIGHGAGRLESIRATA